MLEYWRLFRKARQHPHQHLQLQLFGHHIQERSYDGIENGNAELAMEHMFHTPAYLENVESPHQEFGHGDAGNVSEVKPRMYLDTPS